MTANPPITEPITYNYRAY